METIKEYKKRQAGFSIAEMIVAMLIMIVVMGLVSTLLARSLNVRSRESSRTDALTAAQAALNVMSREIANSGYGLVTNGLVNDSNADRLHFNSNVVNSNEALTDVGEDVTYFFEPVTQSILRYDKNVGGGQTSIIINRISNVRFDYFDYSGSSPIPVGPNATPSFNTGRVRITLTVSLERVQGQVNPHSVVLTSDVTLRNSDYMLRNY